MEDPEFMMRVSASRAQELTPINQLVTLAEFLHKTKMVRFDMEIESMGRKIGKFQWIPYNIND